MTAKALEGRLLGGAYRIGPLLGQGAMGAVYEATHERLGRPVAVKLLLGSQGPLPPDQVQRFEREARAAAALGHPNIVQVTDFQWLSGEPPVLVMERLPGESLGAMIERVGALPVELACFLATQVLDALSAAHQAGIVHRDIKPDNVCLVPMGAGVYLAKVVDFGVAKLTGEAPITSRGSMVGTPAYMAPEQATGQPVDGRTDVYAVGATLYHVLSGRLPMDPSTPIAQVIDQITRVSPPPLVQVVPGIDPQLSAVVARAMEKDIRARFPTAEGFRFALAPFARGVASSQVSAVPSHLARSVGPGVGPYGSPAPSLPNVGGAGPPAGSPPGHAGLPPGHAGPPPGHAGPGGALPYAPGHAGPLPGHAGSRGAPYTPASSVGQPSPITAPSPGIMVAAPVPSYGPALPVTATAPRGSSPRLVVAALVLVGLVLVAGAIVLVTGWTLAQKTDAPPPKAAKPAPSTSTSAPAPSTPAQVEPSAAPSAVPAAPPSGPKATKRDAGAEDAGVMPPAGPLVDAAAPPGTTRVMTRTSTNMPPFGMTAMSAIAAVDAAMPAFRACAQTACLRYDKVVRDEPFVSVDVKLVCDAQGETKLAGFAPMLPPGAPCPLFEQCLARKLPSVRFPKAEKAGSASFTLQVVERAAK